jgi:hypothetical protein
MTDHYFDRATLTKMGQAIKNGHASPVPPEMRETLLGELKANHFSMPSLLRQLAARRRATVVKKKPRWKFW